MLAPHPPPVPNGARSQLDEATWDVNRHYRNLTTDLVRFNGSRSRVDHLVHIGTGSSQGTPRPLSNALDLKNNDSPLMKKVLKKTIETDGGRAPAGKRIFSLGYSVEETQAGEISRRANFKKITIKDLK